MRYGLSATLRQCLVSAIVVLSAPSALAAGVTHEFTIASGWGNRSWNTAATPFRMHVGDTWKIINLDASAQHTLHTAGSPCPHGGSFVYDAQGQLVRTGSNFQSIPVGGWLLCVLGEPIENTDDELYDHFQYNGTDGRIFLSVED